MHSQQETSLLEKIIDFLQQNLQLESRLPIKEIILLLQENSLSIDSSKMKFDIAFSLRDSGMESLEK